MPIYRRFDETGNPTPPVWGNFSEDEIKSGNWVEDAIFLSSPDYLKWSNPKKGNRAVDTKAETIEP